MKIKKQQKVALLKIGKNNNLLFSEYNRARRESMTIAELLLEIEHTIIDNADKTPAEQARAIIEKMLKIGGTCNA